MIERVGVEAHLGLNDYGAFANLASGVSDLRAEAAQLVPRLAGRRIWMLSSTSVGGGVAEMMPTVVALLRELGAPTEWVVMRTAQSRFFHLTKQLHDLIHGHGDLRLGSDDRALYDSVSGECAEALLPLLAPGDLLVVHDPQPLGVGALIKRKLDVSLLWRCHIGTDTENAATTAAWAFLRPYAAAYDHATFSAPEYIREPLVGRSSVVYPSIHPLSHKNRELSPTKLVGILCSASLLSSRQPMLAAPFAEAPLRLAPTGEFVPPVGELEIGIPFRPVISQVSRWDRLKGFASLLDGFCELKSRRRTDGRPARDRRRVEIVRLVLAGPDPGSVQDDPAARQVLAELSAAYVQIPKDLQRDIAIVVLPMSSRKYNALMVNCLQRCSIVVAQNSLKEGFGLSATEAMWKGVAVLGTQACGLRHQIRDQLDGRLLRDPTDPQQIAAMLEEMLSSSIGRRTWGRNGQRRVYDEFLVFTQVRCWLRVLAALAMQRTGRLA